MKLFKTKTFRILTIISLVLISALVSIHCNTKEKADKMITQNITVDVIDQNIQSGDFKLAEEQIIALNNQPETSDEVKIQLRFKKDLMNRIKLDFCCDEQFIRKKLAKYYPNLTDAMMQNWETSNALEMRVIDGEKRYFYNAVPNLFRIDANEKKVKEQVDGIAEDDLKSFCLEHTTTLVEKFKTENKNLLNPLKMKLNYTLTVDADAVPDGETIRCWMPFPREDNARQKEVKLLSANVENYIIAPSEYPQRSIYMEKIAKAGEPTKFQLAFTYTAHAQYNDMENIEIGEYDTSSEFYKKYTSENGPHIVFSDRIKQLTDSLVAGLKNPYDKVKSIYTWIDETTPWASALEYSTFWNIPEYVLDNKHGDCGMQSLLFITMARYAGVPAKWQSGWMLHPNNKNLHDWAEVYYPKVGWVPVDQSFSLQKTDNQEVRKFYTNGIDSYRLIVNDDISTEFYPQKIFPRSETVDFQRGEVEWRGGNLYFNKWDYHMDVEYLNE